MPHWPFPPRPERMDCPDRRAAQQMTVRELVGWPEPGSKLGALGAGRIQDAGEQPGPCVPPC